VARVLIVCVAGVSGTFLARRIRGLDPELDPVVVPIDSVAQEAAHCDAVLVAPQLADRLDAVRVLVGSAPVGLLPESAFRIDGAEAAVAQARELVGSPSYRGTPITGTKE
jgi:cellobiose-specific phosphotransferase system component IIB